MSSVGNGHDAEKESVRVSYGAEKDESSAGLDGGSSRSEHADGGNRASQEFWASLAGVAGRIFHIRGWKGSESRSVHSEQEK